MREQPLALGAVAVALGAIAAAAAPRTRYEDELMGAASDRLTGQAAEFGAEQADKARQTVAQKAAEAGATRERPVREDDGFTA